MPVTAVSTPSGMRASTPCRLWRWMPCSSSQPVASRARLAGAGTWSNRYGRCAIRHLAQAIRLAAVEHAAATLSGLRPTSTSHCARRIRSRSCSTTNTELPASRSRSSASYSAWLSEGAGPPRARRARTHAEQQGTQLRGQPQALQFAGRKRRRGAVQRQVAQAQPAQLAQARHHATGQALRGEALFFRQRRGAAHVGRYRMDGDRRPRSARSRRVASCP
jgi:hypothetical protein